MQSFSNVSAAQTAYGQFRRRWLHGSLRQASIRTPAMTEGTVTRDAFTFGGVLLGLESESVDLNSPSISVLSPSPYTPISTNVPFPFGPFVSPLFSPLTPTMTPRTPRTPSSCLEKPSTGYLFKDNPANSRLRPGLLELDFSSYPTSPRFPTSTTTTIPSPFRMQLQEDVATTPLPSGTPLTARWPGSGYQRSASRSSAEFDGAAFRRVTILNVAAKPY